MRRPASLRALALAPAALAVSLLAAGCATPGAGRAGDDGAGAARIYVTNQDDATVTVLDAGSGEVVETVDLKALGFPATAKPHHVVAEPDGSSWYVSLIGANRVLKLDARNRLVGQAEFEVPGLLALDLESRRLLVGRSMSAVNPPQRIGVIDRDAMTAEEIPVFYPRPHALTTHPAGPLAYSASLAANRMAVVDVAEEHVRVLDLPAPLARHDSASAEPRAGMDGMDGSVHTLVQWAVSPDGRTLVGTGEMSGELLVFDLSDPADPALVTQLPVTARPWHPVFSPDGRWLWFANKGADAVTVVDTRSWTVAAEVRGDGLAEPHGLAIAPDGRLVFVSSNNLRGGYPGGVGTVVVIDAATRRIRAVHPVGHNPTGVGTRARP